MRRKMMKARPTLWNLASYRLSP